MRNIKKFLNEDNSEDQWNQADQFLIDTLNLTSELTKKQVKSKILNFLKQQYNGKVGMGRIKMFAEDFTESICLKLNIEDNSIKESLIGTIKPKFVVGDIIRHKDYPDSQGIIIQRIDYEREAYEGVPPSWVGTDMERSLNSRYAFFKNQDDYDLIGGPSYEEDYEDLVMNSVGESKLYNKIMRNISREIKKALNEMDQSYFTGKITSNICPQCVTVKFKIIENGKESEVFSSRPPLTDWSRKYGYPHEHEDIFIPYAKDWIKRDILSTARRRKTPEEYNELWNNVSVEIVGWDYDDI